MNRKSLALILYIALAIAPISFLPDANAAAQKTTVEGFDFNYTAETDPKFSLVQVFDDGDRTYFQFSALDKYPTVYQVNDNGKRELVELEAKSPYLIVKGVANKFLLQTGKESIVVSYNGKRILTPAVMPAAPAVVAPPVVAQKPVAEPTVPPKAVIANPVTPKVIARQATDQPDTNSQNNRDMAKDSSRYVQGIKINVPFFENSVTVSKKTREDLNEKIAQLKSTHHAIVRGRPSADGDASIANTRSYAIRGILLEAGLTPDQIEINTDDSVKPGKNEGFYLSEILMIEGIASTAQPKSKLANGTSDSLDVPVPAKTWKLNQGKTISRELKDWAAAAGWTLVWNLNKDWAIPASTVFTGDFKSASTEVIKGLAANGVLIRAQYYDGNKTMVVFGPGVAEQ